MKHRIEHSLGIAGVRALIDKAFSLHAPRFWRHTPRMHAVDDTRFAVTFETNGYRMLVSIILSNNAIELVADVPWSLRVFQSFALSAVDTELRRCIAEAQLRRANAHGC